ncbi:GTP pyrophosphokinase family protein [Psychrobacillus psychrodurans]|jgi:putative GTP pyrophosphokinase|uniref:GTP pyrophosphokinase family protein n=1 Tax=Psychrobacillus psychrodurans TaxID=126157 RepID=A0A9X3RBC9_9BACI|nr:GTP pyrophosphokinase family protein [Psychrobacillus psychrodurans]MCK1997545.1 GTP pyrophosphokinase family protein [Psychrobacillus psychrodurans]MCZ8534032.1 GTP pyrophosphokinase family protein [Psychrobacillus psychrodurans]MCZ8540505.1 GTP pyrophosphokinase family protein [Psychrobacillus psychrodurans]SFM68878.1 putative GTP pyrophosphokinase [Psychrobacillus psychrodurans]
MNQEQVEQFQQMKKKMTRMMLLYKFALNELETKIEILREEFLMIHEYNPIEHTNSRLKSPESILKKLNRKGKGISVESIRENVKDIAGMRITCSFISDIYRVFDMLEKQSDIKVLKVKDYIKNPKSNGYKSLHVLLETPVFMSDGKEIVTVEVQIRTIAMDFWASLEHKIFYKYDQFVPEQLLIELKEAADSAFALDEKMERLHNEVKIIKGENKISEVDELTKLLSNSNQQITIPPAFLEMLEKVK